jgi:hypothetical protein
MKAIKAYSIEHMYEQVINYKPLKIHNLSPFVCAKKASADIVPRIPYNSRLG